MDTNPEAGNPMTTLLSKKRKPSWRRVSNCKKRCSALSPGKSIRRHASKPSWSERTATTWILLHDLGDPFSEKDHLEYIL